jgi:serine/threonine protein kinase
MSERRSLFGPDSTEPNSYPVSDISSSDTGLLVAHHPRTSPFRNGTEDLGSVTSAILFHRSKQYMITKPWMSRRQNGNALLVVKHNRSDVEELAKVYEEYRDGVNYGQKEWQMKFLQERGHPNIVACLDADRRIRTTPRHIFFFELCDGNLGQLIKYYKEKSKVFPTAFMWHAARSLFNGLAFIHLNGIIHGNICPDHVLLKWEEISTSRMSNYPSFKICDFSVSEDLNDPGSLQECRGSSKYTPPEYPQGGMEGDVWAMGACLYEMVLKQKIGQELPRVLVESERTYMTYREAVEAGHISSEDAEEAFHEFMASPEARKYGPVAPHMPKGNNIGPLDLHLADVIECCLKDRDGRPSANLVKRYLWPRGRAYMKRYWHILPLYFEEEPGLHP